MKYLLILCAVLVSCCTTNSKKEPTWYVTYVDGNYEVFHKPLKLNEHGCAEDEFYRPVCCGVRSIRKQ